MKSNSKRLALQLTPLLDLLLIVIFAQYLEMEQQTEVVSAERADELALLEYQLETAQEKLKFTEEVLGKSQSLRFAAENQLQAEKSDRAADQEQASATEQELNLRLKEVRQQRDKIIESLKKAYTASAEEIKKLLENLAASASTTKPISPEKIEAMASELEESQPRDLATFLLAYDEIRKRCDIWEIYLSEQGLLTVADGKSTNSIRFDSSEELERKLFDLYKSMPQSKGLVVMLVSYGEVRADLRQQVLTTLPKLTNRMREDADGRTRFEYALIGYLPK